MEDVLFQAGLEPVTIKRSLMENVQRENRINSRFSYQLLLQTRQPYALCVYVSSRSHDVLFKVGFLAGDPGSSKGSFIWGIGVAVELGSLPGRGGGCNKAEK